MPQVLDAPKKAVAMVGIDIASASPNWAKIQAGKDKDCENRK